MNSQTGQSVNGELLMCCGKIGSHVHPVHTFDEVTLTVKGTDGGRFIAGMMRLFGDLSVK